MVKLTGNIKSETTDAVLMDITEDEQNCLQGKIEWFPKSKTKRSKNRKGDDVLRVQEWLYEKKLPLHQRIGVYKNY